MDSMYEENELDTCDKARRREFRSSLVFAYVSSGDFRLNGARVGRSSGTVLGSASRIIESMSSSPTPIFSLHQSIKGLPRCGVATVVRLTGVYSWGWMWEMRYRASKPPIE